MFKPAFAIACLLSAPAWCGDTDANGALNPPEMGIDRVLDNAARGQVDMITCASGYHLTKKGDHIDARSVFTACAAAGYTGAMTWMGQLDNNGLGAEYNPDAAAEWDRRAALAGDPVGQFNYGLDLIRGHGVAQDTGQGRALVDKAAAQGLDIALRLQAAGYDPEEVTPDADNWKYAPAF
ncbi:tetratricopeptide repeat protein [Sedimentitalea xiamensis]|uniref:tetratricopeptide repeat protein n=1 Tax=Sedimentitalea xiamensis TaxID=3050037 RepID=UPI002AA29C4A|nr:sel1 repeat family protein [Sedimentitalea xiamensis]